MKSKLSAAAATLALAAIAGLQMPCAWGQAAKLGSAAGPFACESLVAADFLGVVDAPTQVTEARFVPAAGKVPAYCEVTGAVAPTVGFLLRLPASNWNGKFFERGCGGYCGDLKGWESPLFVGPLRRGYAYITYDGGHTAAVDSALWAYNNLQAQLDFGSRAPHVAALAGKAIVEHYYGKAPTKSYFQGCSSGGAQALSEAQRFPWDFDGIIAGAPDPTFAGPMLYYLWNGRVLYGTVTRADLEFVHSKALQRCDMDDGVKDGVISDPKHCNFDPAELLCQAGQTSACLTAAKIEAFKKVYMGPTNSKGERLYTGGPLIGSELGWINDEACCSYINSAGIQRWAADYYSYVGFMPAPGPGWKIEDFDFDRDYKRTRMSEALFGAQDNPDLRKFKAAGGKLIIYQGLQDESDIPADSIDYYETVEKTMGGPASTRDFFRLFLIPGMNHCSSGPGAFAVDYLDYMEAWAEQGRAPDVMIGEHVRGTNWIQSFILPFPLEPKTSVEFTRPHYPYPVQARYKGTGNPNDAANWGPFEQR